MSIMTMVLRDIALIPTNQGTRQELSEALELAARKGIKPVYEKKSIDCINEGFEDMKAGKVNGRLVYHF